MNPAKKSLFIFDQGIHSGSPAGSCVLAEIRGLMHRFDVTALTNRLEPGLEPEVRWVKIPLPPGPVFLRYWLFQLFAPLAARWAMRKDHRRPDLTQTTEGQYAAANLAYAHFCHRAYLQGPWRSSSVRGLRRLARWVNHAFNAYWERATYRRARLVVVPSLGLARELEGCYPEIKGRIRTISNPVDLDRFERPEDFDRSAWRRQLSIDDAAIVFVFVALGDFARKGLGIVFEALAALPADERAAARVLIVGGSASEIDVFKKQADALGVASATTFVGMQRDVRPYLWCSDVMAFPSAYEIFSLVILQAAAASLPVIVPRELYGSEEFVIDGENGWAVSRSPTSVGAALSAAIRDPSMLKRMGAAARRSVAPYSKRNFEIKWQQLYDDLQIVQ